MNSPAFRRLLSAIVLLSAFAFLFTISLHRHPLGDDVLNQTVGAVNHYSGVGPTDGGRITTLGEALANARDAYLNWGGRAVGFFLFPMLALIGPGIASLIIAGGFLALVLIGGVMVYGDLRSALLHPFPLLLVFLVAVFCNPAVGFHLMWTFWSIYVLSLLLLCLYARLNDSRGPAREVSAGFLAGLNLLGFVAGLTHEVYGFVFLSWMLLQAYFETRRDQAPLSRMFRHAGLLVGVGACWLSPGNFVRMTLAHDAVPLSRSIDTRMIEGFRMHLSQAGGVYKTGLCVLVVLAAAVIHGLYRTWPHWSRSLRTVAPQVFVKHYPVLALPLLWGVFSYTPDYGVLAFTFLLVVFLLRGIERVEPGRSNVLARAERTPFAQIATLVVLAGLVVANQDWMRSLVGTTRERNERIRVAMEAGASSVAVPLYPDICSNRFTLKNYNNFHSSDENRRGYYVRYFGLVIVPTATD